MVETEPEAESKESLLADEFFIALMNGDGGQAASALRQLDNLDGFSSITKTVACLLAWPDLQQGVLDRPLELKSELGDNRRKPLRSQLSSILGWVRQLPSLDGWQLETRSRPARPSISWKVYMAFN
jgi:hypothetical protein